MKKLSFLFLLACVFSCNSSSDEMVVGNDDGIEDPTDDQGGSGDPVIDFSVSVLAENDGEYIVLDIDEEGNLAGNTNLNELLGFSGRIRYNLDKEYLMINTTNNPSIAESFRYNLNTGAGTTFTDYFEFPPQKTSVNNWSGLNHLLTFYKIVVGNEFIGYLNIYDINTGENTTIPFADDLQFNPSSAPILIDGNYLFVRYGVSGIEQVLLAMDLRDPASLSTIDVPFTVSCALVNNEVYIFRGDDYVIYNIDDEILSEPIGVEETLYSEPRDFKTTIENNEVYFDWQYPQPSPFGSGPALYDLSSGTKSIFYLYPFRDELFAYGQNSAEMECSFLKDEDEILVFGYTYQVGLSEFKYGVAFFTYEMELISALDIPFKPIDIFSK